MTRRLQAVLKGHKGAVAKIISELELAQTEETATMVDIAATEESLKKKMDTIIALHEKIIEAIPEENEEDIEAEVMEQEAYIFTLQTKLEAVKSLRVSQTNINNSNRNTATETSTHSSFHRLPKLELPTFSGNLIEWQAFWDAYESAIHENPSLSNVQKFNYLRSTLKGEALHTISGFSLTNANYEKAVNLLQERYGQTDKIIQSYMMSLLEIPAPSYTFSSLREFHDSMEVYIRGLDSLGKTEDTYGSLLVPVTLQKLPVEVRRSMTRAHGTSWTLGTFMKSLLEEIKVLDAESDILNSESLNATTSFTTATFLTKSSNKRSEKNRVQKSVEEKKCVFCNGSHSCVDCLKVQDKEQRMHIVKRERLCFNCLGRHKVADCKSKGKCKQCSRRHHTSLCNVKSATEGHKSHNANESNSSSVLHSTRSPNGPILLKTAVSIVTTNTTETLANILFDEGSQSSFISERVAKKLQLQPTGRESLSLSGFGDTARRVRHLDTAIVNLKTPKEIIPIKVLIVPEISVPIATYQKQASNHAYLRDLQLAHPTSSDANFEIEMLIGADHYWDVVQDRVVRGRGPTAIQSKIGYLLSGPLNITTHRDSLQIPISMMNVFTTHIREEVDIEKFWRVESMGVEDISKEKEYDEYLSRYQDNSLAYDNGKYVAKLPWKIDHAPLQSNESVSIHRTLSVINRLKKDPSLLSTYSKIIDEQEKRGFIEKVPAEEKRTDKRVHYIPHHPVQKDSATTPIRIVYDCSCKPSRDSPSLNECLMNTPPHLNALTGILLRFRLHEYAISTDIEKAFLNVGLHEDDRDVTRFHWLSDPGDPDSPLQIYRFKSVLFGATCSPFILNAVIQKHLEIHPCDTTNLVKEGLYVDNILTSVPSKQELNDFYINSRDIFSKAAFNLRSWNSNDDDLRTYFTATGICDNDKETKILGMRWDSEKDEISFPTRKEVIHDDSLCTKREILQESSSVFDPLGLLSPVTVKGKILMQSLWKHKLDWDEILPTDIISDWIQIRSDIKKATKTKFERCLFQDLAGSQPTLHVFCDSSTKAYGACAYLVSGEKSKLVMAKNKVAPIKQLTVPKLELCAALLGAKLCYHILTNIEYKRVFLWSDSQIVIQWISSVKKLPVFVANRVQEIRELTESRAWRYCPTGENPADLLSRGLTYENFRDNRLWMNGPTWLTDESKFPVSPVGIQADDCNMKDDNMKDNCVTVLTNAHATEHIPGILRVVDIDRFSSYKRLLRVCTYVLRFIDICKKRKNVHEPIEPEDIDIAAKLLIKNAQQQEFAREVQHLGDNAPRSLKPTLIRQLNLYLDNEDILRCGGRIANAPLPETTKFPYLLPSKGKLTELIVIDAHKTQLHSGVSNTVTHLRQRFWIPRIRQRVRNIIRKCVTCRKITGAPYRVPDPPPLPSDRLKEEPPFTVTGVDFTGALTVKNLDGTLHKAYICLFTCASTRAVHLEIVRDMSVESFMLALRRFFSRKSTPNIIMSDNALTFLAASKILRDEILNEHSITWKFIPQHAPWYGGWWERLIGITKNCIKRVLGKSLISLEVLQTIAAEVESIVNDRPLTYTSSDPLDAEPLTPSHLLYGRRITSPVYPTNNEADTETQVTSSTSANKLFRFKSATIERFWSRWRHEYLTSLREFHRASGKRGDVISVGDVVQIHDDALPRTRWHLGVVQDVVVGGDGSIRAATIRSTRGVTTRPISKLYPLEISD